jgi:hypothetical protein
MDGATLQARIYSGYAKAALRIGLRTDLYRASGPTNPLASINKQSTIFASFNAEDMKYGKPNKYGHPTWFGLFDGRLTQVGDYLTNSTDGTYFIAAQQTNLPILLVQCNRTINVLRPQQQTGVGALGYGGDTAANETVLMTAWPASVLQGTKGEKSEVNLPGDVRNPWWSILVPYCGVTLRSGDIVADDLARRYVISSAELTDLGWRITAAQAQT